MPGFDGDAPRHACNSKRRRRYRPAKALAVNDRKQLRPRAHVTLLPPRGQQNMRTLKLAALVAFSALPIAACTINPPTQASAPSPVVVQTPTPQPGPATIVVPRTY